MCRRVPSSGSGARLGSSGMHVTPLYPQVAPTLRRVLAWCLPHKESSVPQSPTPVAAPGPQAGGDGVKGPLSESMLSHG